MVALPQFFDRQFWLFLILEAALLCGPWAARHAAAEDDDFDAFSDVEMPVDTPGADVLGGGGPRIKPGFALSHFNRIVYGGLAAQTGSTENPISQILQLRIRAVDLICELTSRQKQKLELVGQGDIKHLRDRIDELRKEFQLVDDRGAQQLPASLAERAKTLRVAIDIGPFDGNQSVFVKTLRHNLNPDEQALYGAYRDLERRGGKIQLRQREVREIKAIRMTDAAFTDEGMLYFERLTGLEGVLLDYTQVTDKGLVHLAGLANLEVLDLGSTKVKGVGLVHLQNMRCLQVLDLRRTPVTDTALAPLRSLTDLRSLNLGHTRITGTGFAHLKTLKRLETVLLHQTQFTDEGLSHLAELPDLKELSLEGTQISDSGLAHLARLTSLESSTSGERQRPMRGSST